MDRSRVVTLIALSYTQNSIGEQEPVEVKRNVFGNISSLSASEFFDAGRAGLNAEYRVTMFAYDYEGESIVEIDGTRYGVYRTYLGKNETLELYLEQKTGV